VPAERLSRLDAQFHRLAGVRVWRSAAPWVATTRSRGLFEMEFLRHVREAEGDEVTAAGFLKMGGDEIDALILTLFLRDLSAEYKVRATLRDDDNPLAKLRCLEFERGLLPSGRRLEDVLANRPVIKKVQGQSIQFYPPQYQPHKHAPTTYGQWGYALCGLRAYAPSLMEAEREALKILVGMRRLGR
jgi:hypothetical protein